ncbi:MAG: o-succinylbenzoate--CoA ligase [Candidatus Zixiibacteriota bacterium]
MDQIAYPTVRHAERLGGHPAIIAGGLVVSYRELEQRIRGAMGQLARVGLRAGDRVVVAAANSLEWIILAHALPRAGAILAPLHPHPNPSDAAAYLPRLAPALILTDDSSRHVQPWFGWSGCPVIPITDVVNADTSEPNRSVNDMISATDIHTVVPTSGTGGTPKGVCLTMRNHLASALANALNLGINPDDRWLANLPFHHVGGLAIILRAAFYGTTVVLPSQHEDVTMMEVIARHDVTQLSLVATTLSRLLDACGDQSVPPNLRSILVGGGPTGLDLLRNARSLGLPVLPTYGMTETASQVATLALGADLAKLHTVGRPLAMCDVEIRDDEGTTLPHGSDGTICVRSPMLSPGYWIAPGRIEPVATNGWFVTNDIGCLDDDGYLIVHGRRDNVIITGGEKVAAEEVEAALEQCEGVARAAVLGFEDHQWGRKVVALIEMAPGVVCDPDALRADLRRRLETFKIPKVLVPVDQIPLTAAGKIDRRKLASVHSTAAGQL